jgi:hypothetical protein
MTRSYALFKYRLISGSADNLCLRAFPQFHYFLWIAKILVAGNLCGAKLVVFVGIMIANICARDFAGIIDDDNQVCSSVLLCKFAYEILFMNGLNMSNKQHRHFDFHWFVVFEFANSISGGKCREMFTLNLYRVCVGLESMEVGVRLKLAQVECWSVRNLKGWEIRYLWNVVRDKKKNSKRARGAISFTESSRKSNLFSELSEKLLKTRRRLWNTEFLAFFELRISIVERR